MSDFKSAEPIYAGKFARYRHNYESILFECPGCGKWGELDEDQWEGRVSVDHTSPACTYHETHNFSQDFMGSQP